MALFDRFKKNENRNLENPSAPVSSQDFLQIMGWGDFERIIWCGGEHVDTALGVPSVWAAVNFLAGTIAGLPLQVYRKTDAGREKVSNGVSTILHDAVNEGMSSFEWRKYSFEQVLTGGRSLTYIERTGVGEIANLWPLDPTKTRVERLLDGTKIYRADARVYSAAEILDLPFMLKAKHGRSSWAYCIKQRCDWHGDCGKPLWLQGVPIWWHPACRVAGAVSKRRCGWSCV
jgi:phage portal protein BeeE